MAYCMSCFRLAVRRLPSDPCIYNPKVWYRTQRGHWIGWLGTLTERGDSEWRSAQHVYEAIRCCPMILWLGKAVGLVGAHRRAEKAYATSSFKAQPTAIRCELRWELIEKSLFAAVKLRKCSAKFCVNYKERTK